MNSRTKSEVQRPSARARNSAIAATQKVEEVTTLGKTDSFIKRILGWTSVSFALGFVTVLLHTWRIGLPVIEELHPIYVWIGLPLTVVFIGLPYLTAYVVRSTLASMSIVHSAWGELRKPRDRPTGLLFDEALDLFNYTPFVPRTLMKLLRTPIRNMLEKRLAPEGFEQLERLYRVEKPDEYQKIAHQVREIRAWILVASLVVDCLVWVATAIYICGLIWLYVWFIYPLIPQSLGGGAPRQVGLVVEAMALPGNLNVVKRASTEGSPAASSEKATVQLEAKLLYLTKDALYLETSVNEGNSKERQSMSVKADAVKSIIWKDGH